MKVARNRPWDGPSSRVTPEDAYLNRRQILRALGFGAAGLFPVAALARGEAALASGALEGIRQPGSHRRPPGTESGAGSAPGPNPTRQRPEWLEVPEWPAADLFPAPRNISFGPEQAGRELSDEGVAASYNNFYEIDPAKDRVRVRIQAFEIRPWTIEVDGLVSKPGIFDVDELLRSVQIEERIYRHRCVEAWSMTVPWTGFPLRELIAKVEPLDAASFVRFETALDRRQMPGVRSQPHYPWPYVEGIHMLEARNELAFVASGIYGHPLPKQHGAPLRLVLPWKYGFKSVKSIVRITFTDSQPATFWNRAVPSEYGFWACVNPDVPHPRWSQKTERPIPDGDPVPTLIFNGYGEHVAHLYRGMEGRLAYY